jgi:iron complex transport system substrate-binding protein
LWNFAKIKAMAAVMEVEMTDGSLRIVSLIPSGTEIVAALGLTDAIVGRSHECDYPPEIKDRPVCTQARLNSAAPSGEIHDKVNNLLQSALSIYQIKTDVLEKLQPTHIVTQDQCDVCAVSLKDVEQAVATLTNSSPQIISLQPNILNDVWEDIRRVANVFGGRLATGDRKLRSAGEDCRPKNTRSFSNRASSHRCLH